MQTTISGLRRGVNADKPTVVLEIGFTLSSEFGFKRVADGLRAAGLSREVDALQMRAPQSLQDLPHQPWHR